MEKPWFLPRLGSWCALIWSGVSHRRMNPRVEGRDAGRMPVAPILWDF